MAAWNPGYYGAGWTNPNSTAAIWTPPNINLGAASLDPANKAVLDSWFNPPAQQLWPWSKPAVPAAAIAPANPFSLLSNVKSAPVANANAGILAQIQGLVTNPASDVLTVKSAVKSPEMATRITSAGNALATDTANHQASLKDFVSAWLAGQPTATANAGQESAALGRIYDTGPGGITAALQRIADARNNAATTQALNAMRGQATISNALHAGQPNASYNAFGLASIQGQIAAQAATEKADQERANLMSVLGLQTSQAGRRTALTDAALQRMLVPNQVGQATTTADLGALMQLLALTQGNTEYQSSTPTSQLAKLAALLGQGSQLDLANTFYGLQKPFENTNQNLVAPARAPAQPGNNPLDNPDLQNLLNQIVNGGGAGGGGGGGAGATPQSPTQGWDDYVNKSWVQNADGTWQNLATGQTMGGNRTIPAAPSAGPGWVDPTLRPTGNMLPPGAIDWLGQYNISFPGGQ